MDKHSRSLTAVSIADIASTDLPADAADVLLVVGRQHCSPRRTSKLVQELSEQGLAPARVGSVWVESPLLGRVQSGSGDVFKRATALQQQKDTPGADVRSAIEPDSIIVAAPVPQDSTADATVGATVRQLAAAQETLDDFDDPVDFTGTLLLENRPNSLLASDADLQAFETAASNQGFDLQYSVNTAVEGGQAILEAALTGSVGLVRDQSVAAD